LPNFERFDRSTAPSAAEKFLTVQRNWKTISINHASFLALGEPKAMEILYDKSEKILGLRKVAPSEPYAFPIRKTVRSRNYLIASGAFASRFGLQADGARRYPAELIEDEGEGEGDVLAVDLKSGGVEAARGGPRAASSSEGRG